MKSIPEGTVFLIPDSGGQYALGVVARRQPRGRCVALYLYDSPPEGFDPSQPGPLPDPVTADHKGRFHDEKLRDGGWPVLGVAKRFERDQWPFDKLRHVDAFTGEVKIVHLSDSNPLDMHLIAPDLDGLGASDLPSDTIFAPRDSYSEMVEVILRERQ